jgi:hypothetical protein
MDAPKGLPAASLGLPIGHIFIFVRPADPAPLLTGALLARQIQNTQKRITNSYGDKTQCRRAKDTVSTTG